MSRPTLAASATLFDRLDEAMTRAAEGDQQLAARFCEQLSDLGGVRSAFCDWHDQHLKRAHGGSCGCSGSKPAPGFTGRLAAAERALDRLAATLARQVVRQELEQLAARPARLAIGPPTGITPAHWW